MLILVKRFVLDLPHTNNMLLQSSERVSVIEWYCIQRQAEIKNHVQLNTEPTPVPSI